MGYLDTILNETEMRLFLQFSTFWSVRQHKNVLTQSCLYKLSTISACLTSGALNILQGPD